MDVADIALEALLKSLPLKAAAVVSRTDIAVVHLLDFMGKTGILNVGVDQTHTEVFKDFIKRGVFLAGIAILQNLQLFHLDQNDRHHAVLEENLFGLVCQ